MSEWCLLDAEVEAEFARGLKSKLHIHLYMYICIDIYSIYIVYIYIYVYIYMHMCTNICMDVYTCVYSILA